MQNARLDEAQAGVNTAGRNFNNIKYTGDTTIMAESEEELKSLLKKVKELGRPRGRGWRGRWEGRSGWGTHVNPWLFHFNVWQNSLQIKFKKKESERGE